METDPPGNPLPATIILSTAFWGTILLLLCCRPCRAQEPTLLEPFQVVPTAVTLPYHIEILDWTGQQRTLCWVRCGEPSPASPTSWIDCKPLTLAEADSVVDGNPRFRGTVTAPQSRKICLHAIAIGAYSVSSAPSSNSLQACGAPSSPEACQPGGILSILANWLASIGR